MPLLGVYFRLLPSMSTSEEQIVPSFGLLNAMLIEHSCPMDAWTVTPLYCA